VSMPFNPDELGDSVSRIMLDWSAGKMTGVVVKESTKQLKDLAGIFQNEMTRTKVAPDTEVYRVRWWEPVAPGTDGGLFWGVTTVFPGRVGNEYFMTHGHIHANKSRAEYYGTVQGDGMLVLMDESRHTWTDRMSLGSLHYIDGRYAHRIANTGETPLVVWACWPSDAGYDYATIRENGFGARVLSVDGKPVLVPQDSARDSESR
jgi:glucose-6-phosphate isomerase